MTDQEQFGEYLRDGSSTPDSVKLWINTVFRDAIQDDKFMYAQAVLIKIGYEKGAPPQEIVRRIVASTVLGVAGMDPGDWK